MKNTTCLQLTGTNTQVINPINATSDDQMVKECMPLINGAIHSIEREFNFTASDFFRDDLVQEAWLTICETKPNYDPSLGTSLATYVRKATFYAIRDAFITEMLHGATYDYYDEQIEHDEIVEDGWINIQADAIYDADYAYQCREAREECDRRLAVLNSTDQLIVKEVFGLNDGFEHSNESAAYTLGISAERVRQRLNRAMKQLQKAA